MKKLIGVAALLWTSIQLVKAHPPSIAYIVVDGQTGRVLGSMNAKRPQQPASLTKKMTLLLLFEALKKGKITLQTRFPVSEFATQQIPCKLNLQVGEMIPVETLIRALVTHSANDVAVVIAEGVCGSIDAFVSRMNQRAKDLGMNQTHFKNPSGVPNNQQYSTARDMIMLAQALYRDFPEYCHYFKLKGFQYNNRFFKNHNGLLNRVEGLDGIKTGYVAKAGFCISTTAVRYTRNNQPIRLFGVFLGGKTASHRDKVAESILEAHFQKLGAFSSNTFHSELDQILPFSSSKKSSRQSKISKIKPNRPSPLPKPTKIIRTSFTTSPASSQKRLPEGWVNPSSSYTRPKH